MNISPDAATIFVKNSRTHRYALANFGRMENLCFRFHCYWLSEHLLLSASLIESIPVWVPIRFSVTDSQEAQAIKLRFRYVSRAQRSRTKGEALWPRIAFKWILTVYITLTDIFAFVSGYFWDRIRDKRSEEKSARQYHVNKRSNYNGKRRRSQPPASAEKTMPNQRQDAPGIICYSAKTFIHFPSLRAFFSLSISFVLPYLFRIKHSVFRDIPLKCNLKSSEIINLHLFHFSFHLPRRCRPVAPLFTLCSVHAPSAAALSLCAFFFPIFFCSSSFTRFAALFTESRWLRLTASLRLDCHPSPRLP